MQCSQPGRARGAAVVAAIDGWRRTLRAAWLALLVMAVLPSAWAEQHALLIGVNDVGVLPARLRLRGPANDVALMHQALLARGFAPQHMTVLAQRLPLATAAPTFDLVKQAMDRLLQTVREGDTVVFHLAGHGVQVPQATQGRPGAAREPDGLDEVFLLQDSGTWDAARRELPRTLRDDAIGAWIDALVDRGARVFAVFDSCHAAGLAREPTPYTRWRSIAGAELGIPSSAPQEPSASIRPGVRRPARTDGRVLAYAARGHEPAGEEWLPKGGSVARTRVHGVFSFEVAGALLAGHRTAADLSTSLRERYAAAKRISPSPLITGDGPLFER